MLCDALDDVGLRLTLKVIAVQIYLLQNVDHSIRCIFYLLVYQIRGFHTLKHSAGHKSRRQMSECSAHTRISALTT